MNFDADLLVERRRLRRALAGWRIAAILAVVVACGALALGLDAPSFVTRRQAHIARVPISGLIRLDRDRSKMFENIAKSGAAAVILSIDSPGGTVAGSEQLYNDLRLLAAKKPVVAVVEGVAASGAYVAALGADRIVAGRNTLVGSIGVIMQFPNVAGLLKTVGVEVEEIKSSPLKAAPNGLVPTLPEARRAMQEVVNGSYAWFRDLVATRRNLTGDPAQQVSDGRIWTGAQALDLKLVDQLGDQKAAVAWLESKGVAKDTPVRDWKVARSATDEIHLAARLGAGLAEVFGFPSVAAGLRRDGTSAGTLDGLLAVWHPEAR